jgi:hypothetical protein
VPVANTCLLKDDRGNISNDSGKGAGNCTYAFLKFFTDGLDAVAVCHAPGTVAEGGACSTNTSRNTIATQCGTGLTCMTTKGGDQGQCLRSCNANPPKAGFTPSPACNAGETCVNQFRYTDPNDNSVLGACLQSCNVFDATKNTCAKVGTTPASCVPTQSNGSTSVSSDGSGVCVPQLPSLAAVGAACSQVDPFHGAACGSGQVCTSLTLEARAICVAVCDTACSPADGGTGPARCETEPNARCAGGLSCKRVNSTTGAAVGFCE